MKRIQGKKVAGYIVIRAKGQQIEKFIQLCSDYHIPLWDIEKKNDHECICKMYLLHYSKIKKIENIHRYEIEIMKRKGYIHDLQRIFKRKEILFSLILSGAIIFFLSNIVWKVEISGVSVDLEDTLHKELAEYGLYEGAWIYSMDRLDVVQHKILNEIPELLYVGIKKKGTTFQVDAIEKLIEKEEKPLPNQHLVATKNGIIQKMFVKKGQPSVNINDYVKKGDLLVSGVIEEETQDEESDSERVITSAEGKVYASTWYEVNVSSSLYQTEEKLSGEKETRYNLEFNKWNLPIWGFKKVPYDDYIEEFEKKDLYLIKWKLPFSLVERTIYNKESFTEIRSEEEAKNKAIEHVKEDLKLKLGPDSEILKYYVLHESIDSGKVKMNLYISVLENIATGQQIK